MKFSGTYIKQARVPLDLKALEGTEDATVPPYRVYSIEPAQKDKDSSIKILVKKTEPTVTTSQCYSTCGEVLCSKSVRRDEN